ncbi:MAG: hypothetical protein Q8Q07_06905, partial [Dehalococcoidales bacterium]|nr:hypothetical protein [Dehalococcoidales bacterium]
INLFKNAEYPNGLSGTTAWLGIYQVLLWYEPVTLGAVTALPHIIDADKLRPPSYRPVRQAISAWQQRALATERYLAQQLGCQSNQVQSNVDLLMQHPTYQGVQRQNPLGIAFPVLICLVLRTFGNSNVTYELEVPAQAVFPGIVVPGRSPNPRIDVVVRNQGHLRAIISCKWSLRHDRLNDISNECPTYKQAAAWTRAQVDYLVVTNEFDPARLNKILSDSCVDAVVHVHKPLPTTVCGLNSRLVHMLDLVDLLARSLTW